MLSSINLARELGKWITATPGYNSLRQPSVLGFKTSCLSPACDLYRACIDMISCWGQSVSGQHI